MRKIVEFMLTRMDTHPEEFLESKKQGVKHNWMGYYKSIKKFLTEEENKAIWEKLAEINLDETMSHITQKLLEPEDEEIAQSYSQQFSMSKTQVEHLRHQMEHQRELLKIELEARRFGER